jgi:hypothetical protein
MRLICHSTTLAGVPVQVEARTGRPMCESFDLIAGTSTGGMLAVGIGILRMSLHDFHDVYTNLSNKVGHGPARPCTPSSWGPSCRPAAFGQRKLPAEAPGVSQLIHPWAPAWIPC